MKKYVVLSLTEIFFEKINFTNWKLGWYNRDLENLYKTKTTTLLDLVYLKCNNIKCYTKEKK